MAGLQTLSSGFGKKQKFEREIFQLQDFQGRHNFDVIFYPTYAPTDPTRPDIIAIYAISTAMDQVITRLNLYGISVPGFNTLEMENADTEQYVKALTRATEITFTFIETEQSMVINYMRTWNSLIYHYDKVKQTYIFSDNQYAAKKNCKVFLNTGMGTPATSFLSVTGMRPKSMSELTLGHEEQDPYKPEITCRCDKIDWLY